MMSKETTPTLAPPAPSASVLTEQDLHLFNEGTHYRIYDKHKRMRYDLVGNDCVKASEIARALVAEQ